MSAAAPYQLNDRRLKSPGDKAPESGQPAGQQSGPRPEAGQAPVQNRRTDKGQRPEAEGREGQGQADAGGQGRGRHPAPARRHGPGAAVSGVPARASRTAWRQCDRSRCTRGCRAPGRRRPPRRRAGSRLTAASIPVTRNRWCTRYWGNESASGSPPTLWARLRVRRGPRARPRHARSFFVAQGDEAFVVDVPTEARTSTSPSRARCGHLLDKYEHAVTISGPETATPAGGGQPRGTSIPVPVRARAADDSGYARSR